MILIGFNWFITGMHHQGLFRVSGSQHEISEFKQAFERGSGLIN